MSGMTDHEELRVSNDAMDDAVELQRRIAEEGYLFFRRLQDPDKLRALRREMMSAVQEPVGSLPARIQATALQTLASSARKEIDPTATATGAPIAWNRSIARRTGPRL